MYYTKGLMFLFYLWPKAWTRHSEINCIKAIHSTSITVGQNVHHLCRNAPAEGMDTTARDKSASYLFTQHITLNSIVYHLSIHALAVGMDTTARDKFSSNKITNECHRNKLLHH